MSENAGPFDLNLPYPNLGFACDSDSIATSSQLSRSHDENRITSVVYPDYGDTIQSSSLHAHASGIGNVITEINGPVGIFSDSLPPNVQYEENMTLRSYCSIDNAGTVVSPYINHTPQSVDISGGGTEVINCSSVNNIPLGHWSDNPTGASKQSWQDMASYDNLSNQVLGTSCLDSIRHNNKQMIGHDPTNRSDSAINDPVNAEQSRSGIFVDNLSKINRLPSAQVDGNLLDIQTAPLSGIDPRSSQWRQNMERCNSQTLSTLPSDKLPVNSMSRDAGFDFGGSSLIDRSSVSADTQHSDLVDGWMDGQMGNNLRAGDGWPTTAYAAGGIDIRQPVSQRKVTCPNKTSSKTEGRSGVEGISGLQKNHNLSRNGDANPLCVFGTREVGGNFPKPELDTRFTASNEETSSINKQGAPQFERTLLSHQPLLVNKEPSNIANRLTSQLDSNIKGIRPNNLNGNFASRYQVPLSNSGTHGTSVHPGVANHVALSKEHNQSRLLSLPQPVMNLKEPGYASSKGHTSFLSKGSSGSIVETMKKYPRGSTSANMDKNLMPSLLRTPYRPSAPTSTQPALYRTVSRQPTLTSIRSHTVGALNKSATISSPGTVFSQGTVCRQPAPANIRSRTVGGLNNTTAVGHGTLGRPSVSMSIKSHTSKAANDGTVYYPSTTGVPQVAAEVVDKSKYSKVPQVAAKDQIKRLPIQQSPNVPPISSPGYTSGRTKTSGKRICLETAKTTLPVCAPNMAMPVSTSDPVGPSAPRNIGINWKPPPIEHQRQLPHIACRDFTDPVTAPLGARCALCSNDMMFLPRGSSSAYTENLPISAVMACGHTFHVSCLEEVGCSTEKSKDPPCPLCGCPK